MDIKEHIQSTLNQHPVVIFMKGTPAAPQCGFSMQAVNALNACHAEFYYIDILAEPEVRSALPAFSNWPTFPQIFVNGNLIGGCDITLELFQKGELQQIIKQTNDPNTHA